MSMTEKKGLSSRSEVRDSVPSSPPPLRGSELLPPPPLRGRVGEGGHHRQRPLDRVRELRINMTDAERHLWRYLRRRQLANARFRRQYPIDQYIADFVCLEKRLVIELDGGQHAENSAYDRKRDAYLGAQGFRILRFWNDEVLRESEGVLERILLALEETPHPNPPPQGGRGQESGNPPPQSSPPLPLREGAGGRGLKAGGES
jgi:very-short-patch-repair endonuclease